MSLIPRVLPLPIHAPTSPDSHVCSRTYGENIVPLSCQNLVDTHWPSGRTPIHLYREEPSPSNARRLPYTVYDAGCTISIEAAGPNAAHTDFFAVSPNRLRGLAGYVIQKCPVENAGIGGFVTLGMNHAASFITQWSTGTDVNGHIDYGVFPRNVSREVFIC